MQSGYECECYVGYTEEDGCEATDYVQNNDYGLPDQEWIDA